MENTLQFAKENKQRWHFIVLWPTLAVHFIKKLEKKIKLPEDYIDIVNILRNDESSTDNLSSAEHVNLEIRLLLIIIQMRII